MEDRRCASCCWAEIQNEWQAECRRRAPVVDPQAITGLRSATSGGIAEYEHTRGPRTFWPVARPSRRANDGERQVSELLPCPFCGGTDLQDRGDNAIWCKNQACEAGIDIGHSVGAEARADRTKRWNTRAAPLPQTDREWQPIETAPKDGTGILVIDDNVMDGFHQVVFWDDDAKQPGWNWATSDGPSFHRECFTHWKPLDKTPHEIRHEQ
jgi:hypothetical protein